MAGNGRKYGGGVYIRGRFVILHQNGPKSDIRFLENDGNGARSSEKIGYPMIPFTFTNICHKPKMGEVPPKVRISHNLAQIKDI